MLWGCSSGAMEEAGDFDRNGTPYDYLLGGW
jgi:separase